MNHREEELGGNSKGLMAPYPPVETFIKILEDKIRKRRPTPIDGALLQEWGLSKSNASKILPALKFLGIIDLKGNPTPIWDSLTVTDEIKFQRAVGNMIREAYSALLEQYPYALSESDDVLADLIAEIYKTSPSVRGPAVAFLRRLQQMSDIEGSTAGQSASADAWSGGHWPSQDSMSETIPLVSTSRPDFGRVDHSGDEWRVTAAVPQLHINLHLRITPNTKKDQIDAIFESISEHLFASK